MTRTVPGRGRSPAAPPADPTPRRPLGKRGRAIVCLAAVGLSALAVWFVWRPAASLVALERGRAALDRHDPRAAADLLAAAADRDPRNPALAFEAVRAARRAGDFSERPERLAPALDRAMRLGADPEAVRRERLLAAAAAGRLDGPDGAWEELPDLLTDDRGDLTGICVAYVNGLCLLHRFAAADWLLGEWERADPDNAEMHYRRGLVALSLRDDRAAERRFRAALAAAPWRTDAAVKLARILRTGAGTGLEEAVALLAPLAADSADPALLEEYGTALTEAGRPAEAVGPLRRAVALDPADLDRRRPLAEALLLTDEPAAAFDALGPLTAAWPEDFRGRLLTARALRALDRSDEAAAAFAQLREIERARDPLPALIQRADSADDAVGVDVLYRLGRLMLEHEDRGEGVAYLTAALRLDPTHGPAHAALAKAHAAAGRPEFARRHRRLADRYGGAAESDDTPPPGDGERPAAGGNFS